MMQEKNASTPLDLIRVAVLSVMFAPMMIRIGSSLSNSLDFETTSDPEVENVLGRTMNRIV